MAPAPMMTVAPDLVLEVLSPNPRVGTLDERLDLFAKYGVREIWLLHQVSQRFEVVRGGPKSAHQSHPHGLQPADPLARVS